MNKRKKKPSEQSLLKISKAQQFNEFVGQLKLFCDDTVGPTIFKLIPNKEIENIYALRSQPIRIRAIKDVPTEIIKEYKSLVPQLFKTKFIHFGIGKVSEISLYDFFTIGFTLILYANRLRETDFQNAQVVKSALAPLAGLADGETYNNAWKHYFETMNTLGVLNSNLSSRIYVFKHETRTEIEGVIGFWNCFEIYGLCTEKIQTNIDGNNRPAYKIGIGISSPLPHLEYITIDSEIVGLVPNKRVEVYIQSHALNRLFERVDGMLVGVLHLNLFYSLKNLTVFKNKKGEYLFEYRIFDKKVGYFCANLIDGKMIIRTFLFLTHNGTPEGEKLHSNTGLMKEDKKYLAIDKLSSFIHSDISKNAIVKEIFIKAGCQSLFEIDESLIFSKDALKEKFNASLIAEYLKLGQIYR